MAKNSRNYETLKVENNIGVNSFLLTFFVSVVKSRQTNVWLRLRVLYGQNLPVKQNRHNFWTDDAILISLEIHNALSLWNIVYIMTGTTISNRLGLGAHGTKRATYNMQVNELQ